MEQVLHNLDVNGLLISVTQETDKTVLIVVKNDTVVDKKGQWVVDSLEREEHRTKIRYRYNQ